MDKEEILKRSRMNVAEDGDEREQLINLKAYECGRFIFTIVIVALTIFNVIKGKTNCVLWTVFFTFCFSESAYKYFHIKTKKNMTTAILFGIAFVCSLAAFILYSLGVK